MSEKPYFLLKLLKLKSIYGMMTQSVPSQKIPSQWILVVDDEPSVRESLRMILKMDGHRVETVSSGAEALEKLAQGNYDIVFTDHIMGGMTGEQLARIIKAKYPVQIVIMLTAYADVLHRITQGKPLVDFVLNKPIDILMLRLLLRLTSHKTVNAGQEKAHQA